MSESKPARDYRAPVTAWALLALFVGAGVSQARVQLFKRDEILALAAKTHRWEIVRMEPARRGAILASDGTVLAESTTQFRLGLDSANIPNSPGFYMALSAASGISVTDLKMLCRSPGTREWPQPISKPIADAIQAVKEDWRANGVSIFKAPGRDYPLGEAVSGIVGQFRDGKAESGLEKSQNALLEGVDGMRKGLIDRTGAFLPMRMSGAAKPAVDGKVITLTLVPSLQQTATSLVRRAVEAHHADSGVALVMDPKTGDLLAMSQWPSADPETPALDAGTNRATMFAFEPGSTFKILTLAKALDTGRVALHDVVACSGALAYNSYWKIRCDDHHGNRAHGTIDCERAIAKSCNVSAASWALKVGYADFVQYLDQLGLTSKPGLGLPMESRGRFNRNEYAKPLQLMTVGFGQSVSATPVALISAFSMLANDGVRMPARLVKGVGTRESALAPGEQVVKPETAHEVMKVMESVIESDAGTGKSLRIPGYRLAGKTGTAQKVGSLKKGEKGYVSSFVGFVPAGDPKAVVLVMIDNPKGIEYYGAAVAGPVFHDLAEELIRLYQLPPTESRSLRLTTSSVAHAKEKITPKAEKSKSTKRVSATKKATPKPLTTKAKKSALAVKPVKKTKVAAHAKKPKVAAKSKPSKLATKIKTSPKKGAKKPASKIRKRP